MNHLWNSKPFLRVLIGLSAGILAQQYLLIPISISFSVFLLAVIFLCAGQFIDASATFKYQWLEGLVIFALLVSFGSGLTAMHYQLNLDFHHGNLDNLPETFILELSEPSEPKANSIQLVGNVESVVGEIGSKAALGKAIVYLKKEEEISSFNYGDRVLINAPLTAAQKPTNPDQFDYSAYLAEGNVFHTAYARTDQWTLIERNSAMSFWKIIYGTRNYLLKVIEENIFAENEKGVCAALLIGYRQLLPKEIKETYAHTGSMHVLAVSGLHVGIFTLLLNFLFRFLKRIEGGKKFHFVFIVSIIWIFALLTGFKPSVARAAVMFTFLQIGLSNAARSDIYHAMAVSAVILLIINPNNLFRAGFQLSYCALMGILLFQRNLYEFVKIRCSILDNIWQLTTVGIAAQMGTLPLSLYYFGFFPMTFILSNLIVIKGAALILSLGLLMFLLSFSSVLASLVARLLEFVVWCINSILEWIGSIPHLVIHDIYIDQWQVVLLYAVIISFAVFFILEKSKFLRASTGFFALFILLTSFNSISEYGNKEVVAYEVGTNLCVGFHSGDRALIVHDFEFVEEDRTFEFNVRGHLQTLGIKTIFFLNLAAADSTQEVYFDEVMVNRGFVSFDNRTFYFAGAENLETTTKGLMVDYLFVPKNLKGGLKSLTTFVEPRKEVIVAGYANRYRPKEGEEHCKDWSYHFLKAAGARVFE